MSDRVELYGSAIFNAAGEAIARSSPVPWGQRWAITSTSVRTDITNGVPHTAATVYRNSTAAPNRLDATAEGGNDNTTDTAVDLFAGEVLVVVWTKGTPGARADFTATGSVVS